MGMNFNLGILGLPLALSISSFIQLILLWAFLRLKLGSLNEKKVFFSVSKILLATAVMGVVVQFMKGAVEPYFGTTTFVGIFAQGFFSGIAGLAVFVLVGILIRMEELSIVIASLKRKLIKEKKGLGEVEGIDLTVE